MNNVGSIYATEIGKCYRELLPAPPEGLLLNTYQHTTAHIISSRLPFLPPYMSEWNKDIVFGYHPFICTMHHAKTKDNQSQSILKRMCTTYLQIRIFFKTKNGVIPFILFFKAGFSLHLKYIRDIFSFWHLQLHITILIFKLCLDGLCYTKQISRVTHLRHF